MIYKENRVLFYLNDQGESTSIGYFNYRGDLTGLSKSTRNVSFEYKNFSKTVQRIKKANSVIIEPKLGYW